MNESAMPAPDLKPDSAAATASSPIRRFGPLVVLAGTAVLVYAMGWHKYLSIESLATNKDALTALVRDHYLLALLGFAALYAGVVALSLPVASFLTIFGGLLFGALVGGTVIVLAATLGALIVFFIAKTSLGDNLRDKAGPWLSKLQDGFNENAMSYLLFLRLVPVFPFWLINIAPALLGVPTTTYTLGTLAGIIPGTFAFAFVGAGLGSLIDAQREAYQACLATQAQTGEACRFELDPGALITTELLIAFAALGVVALIPVILKKVRQPAR